MTRIALVSCVKRKRSTTSAAQDLYTSDLFSGMRRYAERQADRWFILSAEHGLLEPERIIDPYEKTLNRMPKNERLAWADQVRLALLPLLHEPSTVLMLAGQRYREFLMPSLQAAGHIVEIPMEGLKLGFQLRWLKERRDE